MRLHEVDVVGNGLAYRPPFFLWLNALRIFLRLKVLFLRCGAQLIGGERGQYHQSAPDGSGKGEVQASDEAGFIEQDDQAADDGLRDEEDGCSQRDPGLGRGNVAPAPC